MKRKGKAVAATALAVGFALVAGCGGGGGGGGGHTRTTQFSATNAEDGMVFVGDNMIACQDGTFTKRPSGAARELALARTLPRQLFAFGELINWDGSDDTSGDCTDNSPGTVSVSFDHSSGSTSFSFTFTNYCKRDSDKDRETIFNGTASAKQNGTPGAFGPTYKGVDAKTTGTGVSAATYDTSGVTRVGPAVGPVGTLVSDLDIDISGYSIDFGKPATWSPDAPDAADPDVDTIASLSIRNLGTGDVTRIEDVRIESYQQTLTSSNVTVTGGWVSNTQLGTFSVATDPANPLIIDDFGTVEQGTLIATGAKNTTLTLTANDNLITATVFDGTTETPIATGLECSYISRWPAGLLGFTEEAP